MSALEDEIIAKIRLLDKEAQKRVIALVQQELDAPEPFDFEAWSARVDALQAEIRERIGPDGVVGALDLLAELREEESEWPL